VKSLRISFGTCLRRRSPRIKDGEQTATIKQDNKQMAQVIVRSVVAQIKGETGVKKLLIDGFVIDKSNVDQYLK
jgi:ABC-type sugar transport system substrate-binding protein